MEPASIDERSSRSWPSAPPPPPRGYNCDFMLSCLVKIQDLVIVRLQLFSEKSVTYEVCSVQNRTGKIKQKVSILGCEAQQTL